MASEEAQARSRSPKKNRGISWRKEPTEDKQYKKMASVHSTDSSISFKLNSMYLTEVIFVPLLFIKLRSFHFKPGLITRSHPQASFTKALTSHVPHNYKKNRSISVFLSLVFLGDLDKFPPWIEGDYERFDIKRILRLTCDAKWLLVAYPPFSWKKKRGK